MVTFKLRDRDHTIGIVAIPLSSINRRRTEQWWSLQPYKKEKEAHGELCLQCWVSEWKQVTIPGGEEHSPSSPHTGSQEDLHHGGGKEKGRSHFPLHFWSSSHSSGKPSPTSSDSDLVAGDYTTPDPGTEFIVRRTAEFDPDSASRGSSVCEENQLVPEVTGISPSEGSVQGNEKVILRGSNLGQTKSDVVRVVVADVDCTDTLEYYSSGEMKVM